MAQNTAVAARVAPPPAAINPEAEMVRVLGASLYPGASPQSIGMVLSYCKAAGLDPMLKPVHIVPMWDAKSSSMRDVIMPGIGHYRTQAARSGCYLGKSEPEFGPEVREKIGGVEVVYPAWCKITVKRKIGDHIAEFSVTERWMENYAQKGGKEKSIAPNAMWLRRPYAQLAKCAEAQALRTAFPELTGGEATAEEVEGKPLIEAVVNVASAPAPVDDKAARRAAALDAFAGNPTRREPEPPAEQPEPSGDDTPSVGIPVMPADIEAEWKSGKWLKAWKWLKATVMAEHPDARQEVADYYAAIFPVVSNYSEKHAIEVREFAEGAGVKIDG